MTCGIFKELQTGELMRNAVTKGSVGFEARQGDRHQVFQGLLDDAKNSDFVLFIRGNPWGVLSMI